MVLSSDALRWCLILTVPLFFIEALVVLAPSTFFLRAAWALSGVAIKPNAMLVHTIAMEKVLLRAFSGLAKWVVSMEALSIAVGGGSA